MTTRRYSGPLISLYLSRLREFYRQPARLFWVYGFPTILALGLGLAFTRPKSEAGPTVDVVRNEHSAAFERIAAKTDSNAKAPAHPADAATVQVRMADEAEAVGRLKTGKVPLVVIPGPSGSVTYWFDATRPEAVAARAAVDDRLQRQAGRVDPIKVVDRSMDEPGSRYIDFLIPGLIGQNTMGGGLWGVGFLIVNFRIGKLLKRFAATPMPRRDFLLAILMARLTFLIPDALVLLGLGYFYFGTPIRGSLLLLAVIEVVGALAFAGIGLLIACRAKTTETVSGLMNLVMLPMWIFSGLFFSSERFPQAIQPIIQALPLTQLLNALRGVMLEGAGWGSPVVSTALVVLSLWSVATFGLALRFFRWQ